MATFAQGLSQFLPKKNGTRSQLCGSAQTCYHLFGNFGGVLLLKLRGFLGLCKRLSIAMAPRLDGWRRLKHENLLLHWQGAWLDDDPVAFSDNRRGRFCQRDR